ncbi:MAG: glycosyltransferase family 39 protein [Sphingobacteriaceae bacterium]|nr:glycosyltransferase family 39 protein [Sphingobacteriaceae bacterium]
MNWLVKYKSFEAGIRSVESLLFNNTKRKYIIGTLIFVMAMHFFCSYLGIYNFINNRPSSIHISAQTSRASIALNYYENDLNFFTPQYQRTMEGKGYTGMEFPIVYYLGAVFYKIFGFNEMYIRAISLTFTFLGLLFFYLFSLKYSKSFLLSLGILFAVICSPVFIFYTPNFMPDPPSIAFILASWYFLFRYAKTNKISNLNWFTFFVTLGVLLKVSGAICYGVLALLLVADHYKFFKKENSEYFFLNKKKIIVRMFLSVLIVTGWYKYSTWFPKTHGGSTFLLSTNMYESWDGLLEVLSWMKKLWMEHYYAYEGYVLILAVTLTILLAIKLANRILLFITLFYIMGSACYFFLFLNQFMHHDYYVITMMPVLFFMFLLFVDVVIKLSEKYFYPLKYIVMMILFFNLKESFAYARTNYANRNSNAIYYWSGDFRAYEDLEPKLRKMGITREQRVISGYDYTDCASLYLMNQLGSTFEEKTPKYILDSLMIHPNAQFLILNDSASFRTNFGYHMPDKIVGYHRGLIIYKLKP